jgi:conjugative transfer signal peptidase TraF
MAPPLKIIAAATLGCVSILVGTFLTVRPLIVYNASASVPIGYYLVGPPDPLKVGDLALVRTPSSVRDLADTRQYIPRTVPMIKRIAAMRGDQVCAHGTAISINGQQAVIRQKTDNFLRPMPSWEGCRTLDGNELFLLNRDAPLSFDGRYFGVVKRRSVIGKVRPL